MEKISKPNQEKELPDNNFAGALGGERLASINSLAPHQEKMQNLVEETLRRCLKESNLEKIQAIEIGTGTGLTATKIMGGDERVRLKSVDAEPKMIEVARKNLQQHIENGRIEIFQEDALVFLKKLANNSADVVASALTLHNFENQYREKVLKQIFRILKKDGIFINADKYSPADDNDARKEFEWQMQQFEKAPDSETKKGWIDHYMVDNKPEIIMKEDVAMAIMQEIGFSDIKITDRHHLEALLTAKK